MEYLHVIIAALIIVPFMIHLFFSAKTLDIHFHITTTRNGCKHFMTLETMFTMLCLEISHRKIKFQNCQILSFGLFYGKL